VTFCLRQNNPFSFAWASNSIVVLVLACIGIFCSVIVCLSPKYFHFEALRNDTFYDEDKKQPAPFEYATEANVGIFRYEILEIFEYPWPPVKEDNETFSGFRSLRTLGKSNKKEEGKSLEHMEERWLQDNATTTANVTFGATNETLVNATANATENPVTGNATGTPVTGNSTAAPVTGNSTAAPAANTSTLAPIPPLGAGGMVDTSTESPTTAPTPSPTISNPNDDIDVRLNTVLKYSDGEDTLDAVFKNAQRGAKIAPIMAVIGVCFGLIELCCCVYKCSWLPTALFLYIAFMFQSFTLFLFLSDDWWYVNWSSPFFGLLAAGMCLDSGHFISPSLNPALLPPFGLTFFLQFFFLLNQQIRPGLSFGICRLDVGDCRHLLHDFQHVGVLHTTTPAML
jgi:hypothetical protein